MIQRLFESAENVFIYVQSFAYLVEKQCARAEMVSLRYTFQADDADRQLAFFITLTWAEKFACAAAVRIFADKECILHVAGG